MNDHGQTGSAGPLLVRVAPSTNSRGADGSLAVLGDKRIERYKGGRLVEADDRATEHDSPFHRQLRRSVVRAPTTRHPPSASYD